MTTIREMLDDRRIRGGEVRYLDADKQGDHWHGQPVDGFVAHYIECPRSSWGPGWGGLAARANHMWWADMLKFGGEGKGPDVSNLVEIDETLDRRIDQGRVLLVIDAEVPEEYVDVLEDDDYPVIDDQYWQEAEAVVFSSDWDGWLGRDLRSSVAGALAGATGDEDEAAEMIGDDEDLVTYMDEAKDLWWEYGPWIADAADSGSICGTERNGEHVKGLPTLAEDIARLILRDWTVPSQPYTFPLEALGVAA